MKNARQPSRWTPMLAVVLLAGLVGPGTLDAGESQQRRSGREELMPGQLEQVPELFGATVSRVRVDVIVTGADGTFVTDLEADDFEVYEEGERQEVLDVQFVDLGAGRVLSLMGVETPAADEPAVESAANDPATRTTASDLGAVIFLIDGPSLNLQAKARFGDAWANLLEQTDLLQVPRAAYMIDNVGRLEELAPLGFDRERLQAAAETVRAAPFFGTSVRSRLFEIADDLTNTVSFPNLETARRVASAKARAFEDEERRRALATYELLIGFADALWSRSGRTSVVWVSTGVKLMQQGPYTRLLVGTLPRPNSPDPQVKAAQDALHRAANASNVSFYAIDPSLLSETRSIGSDIEVRTYAAASRLSTPALEQSLDGLRDSMRMAAAATGGRAYIQATDIAMVLEEIESDTSRFYLISYEPPRSIGDGEYHEITVEVLREDVDVRARGGYVDSPPDERVRRSIEAALALPGVVTELSVSAEAFRSRSPAGGPNLLLAVAVDGGELGLAAGAGGEHHASIDVYTVVVNADGVVDEAHEQLSARLGTNGAFRSDPDSPLAPTVFGFLAYQREWTLEPGDYVLKVAVLDNVSGKLGAASIEVEIPVVDGGWAMSDPLIVATTDAGRVQPIVLGRILERQNISVYVEVYGGVQPILSGQVFLEASADDSDQQGAKLFPMALRRVAANVHRGSAPLPPGMPPGRYFVQLVITDSPAGQHQVVRLPIDVVGPPAR